MKQLGKFIPLSIILIVVWGIGYFLKENRTVYNYGDTYYVLDYFTVSLLVSLLLVVLTFIVFGFKKIIAKRI
jgi:uncharacterized membrane protein